MKKIFPLAWPENWQERKFLVSAIAILIFILSIITTLFFCYFFPGLAKNISGKKAGDYRATVYNLVNENRFSEAEQIIKKELLKDSEACGPKIDLAGLYLERASVLGNRNQDSLLARQLLVDLEKKKLCLSDRLYLFWGYSYEVVNDFNAADDYYGKGLSLYPDSIELLFQRGHLLWLKGDEESSLDLYLKTEQLAVAAATENATKGKLYLALASYYGSNGRDVEKAEEYFQKAVSLLDSKRLKSEAYYGLSTLSFYYKNNFSMSLEYGLDAIKADSSNDLGYLACARVKIDELATKKISQDKIADELKTASEYLNKALSLNPQRATNSLWQGQLTFLNGDIDGAVGIFDQALIAAKSDPSLGNIERGLVESEIYFAQGVVYHSLADQSEAQYYFEKAFALNPVKTVFMLGEMKIDREFLGIK